MSAASLLVLWVLLALVSVSPSTAGEDTAEEELAAGAARPRFAFDGFGTLGLVHSSEDQADFVVNPVRPEGAGFSRAWSAEVDSRLGLQLTAHVTEKLSAVVQVIVEQQHDDELEPTLEWANLQFAVTDDLSVRIGRTALPTFAAADFRKVGFVHTWVRPPVELYSLAPIFNSDGIDVSYRHRLAGWTNSVQAIFGRSDVDLAAGGATARIRDLAGVFDTLERGDWTVRGALSTARVSIGALDPLFEGFRLFGPEGQALAERFEVASTRVRFAAVGATYDPGRWFVTSELGRIRTRSALGDRTAGYATFGYRLGAFTPFVTYSEAVSDGPISSPGLTLSGLPPQVVPIAAALNDALDGVLAAIAVQRTLSVGTRWDYRANAALKVQIDQVDVGAASSGTFVNLQPGFARGGSATLLSIATSFVF